VELAVSAGGRLVIGAWAGSVNVSAGRGDTLQVAVKNRGVLPPPPLEVDRAGDDVYVEAGCAPFWRWLAPWAWRHVQLEVSVPERWSVDVETRSGRVAIDGVGGAVEARSQRGHLIFCNVRGAIDARTTDGSIDVSDCRGDVDVATARGTIEIQNVEGQVWAQTRGGRIAVSGARGSVLTFA
jgi:hypothetical protein